MCDKKPKARTQHPPVMISSQKWRQVCSFQKHGKDYSPPLFFSSENSYNWWLFINCSVFYIAHFLRMHKIEDLRINCSVFYITHFLRMHTIEDLHINCSVFYITHFLRMHTVEDLRINCSVLSTSPIFCFIESFIAGHWIVFDFVFTDKSTHSKFCYFMFPQWKTEHKENDFLFWSPTNPRCWKKKKHKDVTSNKNF